jgi:hypothetical protein
MYPCQRAGSTVGTTFRLVEHLRHRFELKVLFFESGATKRSNNNPVKQWRQERWDAG